MALRAGQPEQRGPLLPGLLLVAAALSRPAAPCPFQCYCFGGPKLLLRCASGAELRQPPRDVPPDARNLTIVGANLTVLRAAAFAGGDADGEEVAAGGVRLPLLTALRLTHNNIEVVEDGAFDGLPSLAALDLSHNPLRALGAGAFRGLPALRSLQLNHRLRCAAPRALHDRPFLDLDEVRLRCADGAAEGRGEEVELAGPELEASYVFFGLVLALIGLIFLMVLYLNRRGIQRWMRNLREACRDQMEGYHYRYEQDADPRRAPAPAVPAGSSATSPGSGL
ncbi:PREDICTED: trophoblast glycoprotein-like [Ceratotherium simum simum]|uniref:Trophoblast glycoprotein-like n=1 Tax=Ceratotherium simum simum TaxID=73337 RepID=A0ABM0HUF0_CERSS|nr:PREDICTED: trophoblast glycoprotein-like [Ceratotherium simum simum]